MSTRLVPASDIAYVVHHDHQYDSGTVYVTHLPSGPALVLEGSSSTIWQTALDVPENEIPAGVASFYGQSLDEVRRPVEAFVADLISGGYLTRSTKEDPDADE